MTVTAGSRQRLVEMLAGYVPVQLVYVMARLKLAELLSEGPRTVKELSFLTRTQPDMMPRLVRGLAGVGLVAIEADGSVSLTELGAHLDGAPGDPCATSRCTAGASRSAPGGSSSMPSEQVSPDSRQRTEPPSSAT
jgi:hypothetical protein